MDHAPAFEEDRPDDRACAEDALVLALDGFEGPIDMLLAMARDQKVDLLHISILALADQYLAFIADARSLRIELAADYLVMAAWLAYLKSKLLLPDPPATEDELSGEEMAAALAFQLRRLEAMREAGERLMARPRLGRDVFARGAPEGLAVERTTVIQLSLFELLRAYGEHRRRVESASLRIPPTELYSIEEAIARLSELLGRMPDWATMASFLPSGIDEGLRGRSAVAATFVATLELVKAGQLELRQDRPFAPIWVRRRASDAPDG